MTSQEIKSKLESETGLKFSISKNRGSMKNYITFRVFGYLKGVEIDVNYGRQFRDQFPFTHCYFSNGNSFHVLKSHICDQN